MEIKEAIKILKHLRDDLHLKSEEYVECFTMAISALEKQDGKKPVNVCYREGKIENAKCPSCGYDFPDIGGICESYYECEQYNCCPDCGQRIDWSD